MHKSHDDFQKQLRNRFSLISVGEIFPRKNIWIYEGSNCKIKMFRTPFGAFPAKLLFASCGDPLIKDIMQNGNCIIDVFLKWSLIAPNSFTLILPQHWKLTLYWFLFLQHSDSTVSRIVSTSTPSSFLLPRKHLWAFQQHWPTQMVTGACGKRKTGFSEGLLDGFQAA